MKVKATVHGAVSILNAIPTGIGGALGIDLETTVEASELNDEERIRVEVRVEDEEEVDTRLVETTARRVLKMAGRREGGILLRVHSNIPVARGLKSSSAVANAVALSVSRLVGTDLDLVDAVNVAVDSSIEAGVSVTGAYDDAVACMLGGVNITDNYRREILARWDIDEDLRVIISVPDYRLYTGQVDVAALKEAKDLFRRVVDLALEGRIWDAMILNGVLVASALGLDFRPVMAALRRRVLASGISGKGPAVVAVTPSEYEKEVENELKTFGKTIRSRPSNKQAKVEVIR